MRDTLAMQICQNLEHLLDKSFGILFGQSLIKLDLLGRSLSFEVLVKALTFNELHNDINVLIRLESFTEFSHVPVHQLLHQHNFPAD